MTDDEQPTPRGQSQRSGVPDSPEDGESSRDGAARRGRFSYIPDKTTGAIATGPSDLVPTLTCTQHPLAKDTYAVRLRGVGIGEVRRYSSTSGSATRWKWRVGGAPWSQGFYSMASAAADLRRVFECEGNG